MHKQRPQEVVHDWQASAEALPGNERSTARVVLCRAASSFVTGQTLWVDGGAFTMPNWPYPRAPEA
jgi:NAD(P)-dependent dehydrogenase (short-subunit alcohol dehydrogenase family)